MQSHRDSRSPVHPLLAFDNPLNDQKPRLLFLNRCYWPDSEATGQLLTDLCESLTRQFDVHVVCGQPNSPTTQQFLTSGTESRNQVTIHRLPHTHFAKRVPAGRLLNLVSFTRAADKYLRSSHLGADIVISETDPFLLPIVAARHSRRVEARLVCYLQDIYPDVAEAIGKVKSGLLTNQIRSRLRGAYVQADRIIVLGDCMRKRLRDSPWSLDPNRLTVIPNWADCQAIQPQDGTTNALREREGLADRFIVMHSGNMGLTQRLEVLVDATRSNEWPDQAVLVLVGDGAAKKQLEERASQDSTDRIRLLPYQPREELATSLSAADLHVVSMHQRIAGCLCPSKLYGILAAGRPVLSIASESTDLHQCVHQEQLGWCCQPGDIDEIAKAVAEAAMNHEFRISAGKRARQIALAKYDRDVVIDQFASMLSDTLEHEPDSRFNAESDRVKAH